MLAEPSAPAVRNWLLGMPAGFVIVAVTRPDGNPVTERSHVEPRGPVLLGRTLTFAPDGGGGAGGFVRGAAVGAGGAGGSGVAGGAEVAGTAALPGTAELARADPEAAGRPVGVVAAVTVVPVSQPMSATARTATATKRGCMPVIVRSRPESQAGVLSRGMPVAPQLARRRNRRALGSRVMGVFDQSDPAIRAIYDRLLIRVRRLGPVVAEENKTSIHLKSRAAFAGVHPLKSRLDLNIVSAEPIADPRVKRRERVSASRYHNLVSLSTPRDIDSQLIDWLQSAYELGS